MLRATSNDQQHTARTCACFFFCASKIGDSASRVIMKAVKAKRVLTFAAFILVSSTHIGQWLCLGRPNLAMLSVPMYSCIPCVLAHNAAWRLNACKTSFHGLPFKPKKRCSVPSSNESIIAAGIRSRKVPKCTMCKRSSNLFFLKPGYLRPW